MGALGVSNIDCAPGRARRSIRLGPRQLSVQSDHRRHRAGRRQLLIVGANPRREAPVLNARIRKRWRAGNVPVGVIGEKADLTYPYDYLGAGAETPGASCVEPRSPSAEDAEKPMFIIGAGRARAPGRRAPSWRWPPRRRIDSAPSRTAGTASPCCTPRRRASARSISASCRARAASTAAPMLQAGALDVLFLLGADEVEVAARRLRRLYRHPWRSRRAPRRRHPAGRRLSGKIRRLYVNTEGRVQMAQPRRVPAGRCARGLGDPARAVGRARPQAALRLARRSCARRSTPRIRI